MRPTQVLASFLAFSALAAAWPEPIGPVRRQDTARKEESITQTATKPTNLPPKADATTTNDATGTDTKLDATKTGDSTRGTGTSEPTEASETEYNPMDPAGGVQMVMPAPTAMPSFYRIGDFVTFKWNYTSLSSTPSYIDILATCSSCPTHTISANQSGLDTQVIWDTDSYQKSAPQKLDTKKYTLIIHDAAKPMTAAPRAGYLDTFRTFQFAMYIPKPPIEFKDYKCAACSGAMSSAERQTMTALFSVVAITIFSFTWFAGSFGLF